MKVHFKLKKIYFLCFLTTVFIFFKFSDLIEMYTSKQGRSKAVAREAVA